MINKTFLNMKYSKAATKHSKKNYLLAKKNLKRTSRAENKLEKLY